MDNRNPAECLELLKHLHPADTDEAHQVLSEMLRALLDAAPAPNQHLEVLEAARPLVARAQTSLARRYTAHPLPPDSIENDTLGRVVDLWRTMAHSYADVALRDAMEGTLDDQRALLAQRRLHYTGQTLLEHYRAHRALPLDVWSDLHECFTAAEANNVARIRVSDPLNDVWKAQSTAEAFVAVLLVDLANPYGRGEQALGWVCRWAQRFAPYCSVEPATPDPTKPAAYGLDLSADHGLRPLGLLPPSSDTVRRFDGVRLAGQIQAVLSQFKQGVSPASLGLGNDCPKDACSKLLLSLYRPWGLASAGRRFARRGSRGKAALSSDWLATGFHVAGKVFQQPATFSTQRSVRSDITLLTFGERVEGINPEVKAGDLEREARKLGFACDEWDMADQSVGGFRLTQRPHGERLEHHQLVGIRPPDGERFLLGMISWLMFRNDGILEAGVHILPGMPRVVAARMIGLNPTQRGSYQQAFMLAANPALKATASLVLPAGWYQAQRVIELHDDRVIQLRLTSMVTHGTNFDQVSFELLDAPARDAKAASVR